MNVTEAPAVAADDREQPDDMLTRGWAAPAADRREVERLEALGVAQRNTILQQGATVRLLEQHLAETERERDSALETAVRYRAESIRLDAENRGLRGRVDALTRANHARSARVVLAAWARRAGWSR